MKKYVKYILTILLMVSLFFFLFVLKNNNVIYSIIALAIYLFGMFRTTKYVRPVPQRKSDELFIVIGFSILFLGITFLYGFLFDKSSTFAIVIQKYSGVDKWISVLIIVVLTELIRYFVNLSYDKNKITEKIFYFAMFVNFVLIDLIISPRAFMIDGVETFYEFMGIFAIQSISKNILLNYLSFSFGFIPCIWYRLLNDLFPFEPQINVLIYSVLLFILPFLIYYVVKSIYDKKKKNKYVKKQNKKLENIYTILLIIILGIIVCLVSCEFHYGMIAVGSGSMTGAINKGDAVIYEKFDRKSDKLNEGDIIIFKKNDIMVVHRIYKKNVENGLNIYQTKGDANESVDSWTVDDSEIVGIVRIRILLIAWPSVWLSELF